MSAAPDIRSFFVLGGTLKRDAASYVTRPADAELLRLLLAREWCNVLAARQMGKSSLMVRTVDRLKTHQVRSVVIDLTAIGSDVMAGEWYFGLVTRMARQLRLKTDEQAWWQARSETSPVQKFSDFVREVVLEEIAEPVVVFIDEIDSTLRLPFTDDFFAAVRALYNARSADGVYERLTFVLLGVARPADLIKDRSRTPYNIGVNVDLTDFTFEEAHGVFAPVLEAAHAGQGADILRWVLAWTGGQPYLTQKLCAELTAHRDERIAESDIDQWVERLFLADEARKERNLQAIRDRVLTSPNKAAILKVYRRVVVGQRVPDEERSIDKNELKLTGLVRATPDGLLAVRNLVYARVFDGAWAKDNLPVDSSRRLAVAGVTIAVLAGFAAIVVPILQRPLVQAQTLVDQFNSSQSAEVRLTSLAGLFELDAAQARALFFGLGQADRLALFGLSDPQNVAEELANVVAGVYQRIENTPEGNDLLRAIADALAQVQLSGATSLVTEIEFWHAGRSSAADGQYDAAIRSYDRALELSLRAGRENPGVRLDRALAYAAMRLYDEALADLEAALSLDDGRVIEIVNMIVGNPSLAARWGASGDQYPRLNEVMPTLTPTPTQSPTPTSPPIRPPEPTRSFPVPSSPVGLTFDGERVWVSVPADNAVLALDPATGDIVSEAKTGQRPYSLFFDGRRLWVANVGDGTVQAITVESGATETVVDLGATPVSGTIRPSAFAFDGTWLWVADYNNSLLQAIDPESGALGATLPTGLNPSALVFDGTQLWATSELMGQVQAIDPIARRIIGSIAVGARPAALVFDGARIWVANSGDDTVQAIDVATREIVATIKVESGPAALAFDGQFVWVANSEYASVQAIDPVAGRAGIPIGVGTAPSALASNGKWLWIAVSADNKVHVIDVAWVSYLLGPVAPPFPTPTPFPTQTPTPKLPSAGGGPPNEFFVADSTLDLLANAESAIWSNASGQTGLWLDAYPTESNEQVARGYAAYVPADRTLETGTIVGDRLVLATHPQFAPNGVIEATVILHLPLHGARFVGTLEFLAGAEPDTDGVHVEVWWYASARGDTPGVRLDQKDASDNRSATGVEGDLSSYGGQTGELRIIVHAGATANNDWLTWTQMIIEPIP